MTDTINKSKLQLKSVVSFNGDKTPSPATKLLINHGKPNFTISRSPKVQQNGNSSPLSPQAQNDNNYNNSNINNNSNNNYYAFKTANSSLKATPSFTAKSNNNNNDIVISSTKFNGAFKPSSVSIAAKQSQQDEASEFEATKVQLRRTKTVEQSPAKNEGEDENVPEFIRRQRRIQERLAKENILDFENRRSGYFTHVMITPTSPNRTSFVETMSSPAIVPALEMPPPVPVNQPKQIEPEATHAKVEQVELVNATDDVISNGNSHFVEEEEVASAIEEVNRAVAGEDELVDEVEPMAITTTRADLHEEPIMEENTVNEPMASVATKEALPIHNGNWHPIENGHQNGHAIAEDEVTISHVNSMSGPALPSPDPSGALGVNFEPKTVVSFSKDLSSEPNKYPDTVKVVKEGHANVDEELQEIVKLKFDIKTDEDDVQVTPVLRATE